MPMDCFSILKLLIIFFFRPYWLPEVGVGRIHPCVSSASSSGAVGAGSNGCVPAIWLPVPWPRFGNKQLGGGKAVASCSAAGLLPDMCSWVTCGEAGKWHPRPGGGRMGGRVHAARQAALVTHSFRAGARACVVLLSRKCQMGVYRLELPSELYRGLQQVKTEISCGSVELAFTLGTIFLLSSLLGL